MTTTHPYSPNYATPPGWTLEETLEELSMSQAELARRTGLPTNHINRIVRGKVPTPSTRRGDSSAPPVYPTGSGAAGR